MVKAKKEIYLQDEDVEKIHTADCPCLRKVSGWATHHTLHLKIKLPIKALVQEVKTLKLLFTEEAQTNTIIIPPKNIIIKVYINHILPKKCIKVPKTVTLKINLKHIIKGDFEIKIKNKATSRQKLAIIIFNLIVIRVNKLRVLYKVFNYISYF